MESKDLAKFAYLIVPKPGGGFIARPSDPTAEPIEAPTREELQHKIQAKIAAELGSELAGLELALGSKQVSFHTERKPGAILTVHPTGANTPQELVAILQKSFPELSGALVGTDAKTFGNLNEPKMSS